MKRFEKKFIPKRSPKKNKVSHKLSSPNAGLKSQQLLWSTRLDILSKMKLPSFIFDNKITYHPGGIMTLRVKGCTSPVMHLDNKKIFYLEKPVSDGIFIAFTGVRGPAIARGNYDPSIGEIKVVIPDGARSGPIVVHLPVTEVKAGSIPRSGTRLMSNVIGGRTVVVPVITMAAIIPCDKCRDAGTSLCPHGNIKYDADGYCYVDQDSCLGQKQDDSVCWDCFPQGSTDVVSTLCENRTLKKTLYISRVGDDWCCGCCPELSQKIPGRCLMDLCAYDAITGGNLLCDQCPEQVGGIEPHPGIDWGYFADPFACMGCAVCFDNIICHKVQMKAFLGNWNYTFVTVLRTLTLRPIYPVIPESLRKIVRLGIWHIQDHKYKLTEIPIQISDRPIILNREISSDHEMHFALYARKGKGPIIPLGFDISAAVKTISNVQRSRIETIRFNTVIGTFDLGMEFAASNIPVKRSHRPVVNNGICES